jgi:hypothetical protein
MRRWIRKAVKGGMKRRIWLTIDPILDQLGDLHPLDGIVYILLGVAQPRSDTTKHLFGDGGDGERRVLKVEEGRGGREGEGEGGRGQEGRGGGSGYRVAHGGMWLGMVLFMRRGIGKMRRWSTIWRYMVARLSNDSSPRPSHDRPRCPSFGHFRMSHIHPAFGNSPSNAVIIMPSEMPYMIDALLSVTHNSTYPCASRSPDRPDLYKLSKPQSQPPHLLTHPLLSLFLKTEKTLLFCRP